MAEIETKPEIKSKLKYVEVDKIPPAMLGPRNGIYDEALSAILNSGKDTINLQIEGKTAKEVYSGVHNRVSEYNKDPERTFDLKLAQRRTDTYLQRCPKDSIQKKQTK